MIPRKIYFVKGVGKHKEQLSSFEAALRDAGIEKYNLVNVSSIFPPHCKIVRKEEGMKYLQAGQILFVVLARSSTNEPNRLIGSSIGVAIPADGSNYGYLSEHHGYGETQEKMSDYSEDLAATMLASTLGIEFDTDKAYDERKEQYMMSGKIIKTRSVTQTAQGDKNGLWTTVVCAAVMVTDVDIKRTEQGETPHDLSVPDLNEIDKQDPAGQNSNGQSQNGSGASQ